MMNGQWGDTGQCQVGDIINDELFMAIDYRTSESHLTSEWSNWRLRITRHKCCLQQIPSIYSKHSFVPRIRKVKPIGLGRI
jgi:hypothetical protein